MLSLLRSILTCNIIAVNEVEFYNSNFQKMHPHILFKWAFQKSYLVEYKLCGVLSDHPPAHILAAFKPFIKRKNRDHNEHENERESHDTNTSKQSCNTMMVAATAAMAAVVVIYLFASFQISSGKSYFPHNMLKWRYRLLTTTTLALARPMFLFLSLLLFCTRNEAIVFCIFPNGSMCQLTKLPFSMDCGGKHWTNTIEYMNMNEEYCVVLP